MNTMIESIIDKNSTQPGLPSKLVTFILLLLGFIGIGIAVTDNNPKTLWVALLVNAVFFTGVSLSGAIISVIFQLTGAKWGRVYRRIAETSISFMPISILAIIILLIAGNNYLPWIHAHHLTGGKHIWLTRGFWDVRIVLYLSLSFGMSLLFIYYSWRRDFSSSLVSHKLQGKLSRWLGKNISKPQSEAIRCEEKLGRLAPIVGIIYAFCMTFFAFDIIMALEYDWFSTLFGAWYFIGNIFSGFALVTLVSLMLKRAFQLEAFFTTKRQSDLATLLFAFVLLNTDFFWSQYLTIWYGNLPEETGWVIRRTLQGNTLPSLSWITLAAFFAIPFIALLFRKVKTNGILLGTVAIVVIIGIFLARFLEISPVLLASSHNHSDIHIAMPLLASGLLFFGFLGCGSYLFFKLLRQIPIMPVGDPIFVKEFKRTGDDHE